MDVAENRKTWGTYDWPDNGAEWSLPWGSIMAQWVFTVYPRICNFLPTGRIMEIGPGAGRWSSLLHPFATQKLVLVDLTPRCISLCRERFQHHPRVECYLTDGYSLSMVADQSVDFVFSLDSLVHADYDVMAAYLRQFADLLAPGGAAFIHHSNAAESKEHAPEYRDHARSPNVGQQIIAEEAKRCGLGCLQQEIISWGLCKDIDCLTTLVKDAQPEPRVIWTDLAGEREAGARWTIEQKALGFRV